MVLHARRKTQVCRNGSSLVATFEKANPPLVWRFDLERSHSFTIAMQGHDGEWELGVTSLKGEFHPVARFPLREDAEEAFEAVGRVLARSRFAWVFGGVKILVILLVLFFLGECLVAAFFRAPPPPAVAPVVDIQPPVLPDDDQPPASNPQAAVPVPADTVLKPPATP